MFKRQYFLQKTDGKKMMVATKQFIFNMIFSDSYEPDSVIGRTKCRIYTGKMAVKIYVSP